MAKKTEQDKEKKKKVVVVEEVKDDTVTEQKTETSDTEGKTAEEKIEKQDSEKNTEDSKDEKENDSEDMTSEKEEELTEETESAGDEKKDQEVSEEKPKSGRLIWIIVPTTLLVGALAGGVITYFSGVAKIENPMATPQATITPSDGSTPSPEPSEELDRSDLKVQVLNGSGVSGAAGEAAEILEDLGYVDVAVGNASSTDYEETEIAITEESEDYLNIIKEDLSTDYTVSADTETLSASSSYDVVITLGAK